MGDETKKAEPQQSFDYDFVVLGAGASAMGLLYGLLSPYRKGPTPPFSIAVLERGHGPPYDAATVDPNDWCSASHRPSRSATVIQSQIGNRVIDIPMGTGLGGSTIVNACLYTPPSRDDFVTWPVPWRETIFDSVKTLQNAMNRNGALSFYRSSLENLHSIFQDESIPVISPAKAALWSETVFPSIVDGMPTTSVPTEGGRHVRRDYYQALLEPLLSAFPHLRKSVTFICGAEAQRLLFSRGNHVCGIEYETKAGELATIHARCEVVICAGAIETPALLLTSGIGHEEDLKQAGIVPRIDGSRLGVGRNLCDHVLLPRLLLKPWFTTTSPLSPSGVQALVNFSTGDNRFQIMFNDAGVYSQIMPHYGASLLRRRYQPSNRCLLVAAYMLNWLSRGVFLLVRALLGVLLNMTPLSFLLQRCTSVANLGLLNPQSMGSVKICRIKRDKGEPVRRRDVDVKVDAGYLSHPDDLVSLRQGWEKFPRSMFGGSLELLPGALFYLVAWLQWLDPRDPVVFEQYARLLCVPYFHWYGTCRMEGNGNEEGIVDSQLRLLAISGVRVCDASVFPSAISGPTALTCAAMGHVCAGMIERDFKKKQG